MAQSTAMVVLGGFIILWMIIVGIIDGITGSVGFLGYHIVIGGTFGTLVSISTTYAVYILALAGTFIFSGVTSTKFFLFFLIVFEFLAFAFSMGWL